jgi:hypothetical protein
MTRAHADLSLDGVPLTRLESDHLRLDFAPSVGGRVVSLVHRPTGHEFLWRNPAQPLRREPAGGAYDPHFFGGIDELLPNDVPETLDGVDCPDHGELWTTALDCRIAGDRRVLSGDLPRFGLHYEREMSLRENGPQVELAYRITNCADDPRSFLWKLHAAVAVQAGDVIDCPARRGQVVDLAWSRYRTLEPFAWPLLEGRPANLVPPADGTVDFFYLFDLEAGRMAWRRPGAGLEFAYEFDPQVFPFAWMFASYGGFDGHYTVVLEPCTAMPLSVRDAAARHQCSRLEPGQTLATRVVLHAGPIATSPHREP